MKVFDIVIGFIPVIGWLISFLGNFVISSYFYGFSFMDYTNERQRLSLKDSIAYISNNKGLAIGIGSVFVFCFFIPSPKEHTKLFSGYFPYLI